jgi:uncharacterized repeat protein (TIGR03803 family)
MPKLITNSAWKTACAILVLCAAIPSTAQTFTTLHSFDGQDGANPGYGPLVQNLGGNFNGTTPGGFGGGKIYKIAPGGAFKVLNRRYGGNAGVVLATDGNFYGTTETGGTGYGTVFKVTVAGALTILHSFTGGTDGGNPWAGLVRGTDGNFYGHR